MVVVVRLLITSFLLLYCVYEFIEYCTLVVLQQAE